MTGQRVASRGAPGPIGTPRVRRVTRRTPERQRPGGAGRQIHGATATPAGAEMVWRETTHGPANHPLELRRGKFLDIAARRQRFVALPPQARTLPEQAPLACRTNKSQLRNAVLNPAGWISERRPGLVNQDLVSRHAILNPDPITELRRRFPPAKLPTVRSIRLRSSSANTMVLVLPVHLTRQGSAETRLPDASRAHGRPAALSAATRVRARARREAGCRSWLDRIRSGWRAGSVGVSDTAGAGRT